MELAPGYKQTEAGVIPEDWKVYRLDSLGVGSIPPIKAGPFGSSLTKDTYVPIGYKVYGQEQVIRGDYLYGNYYISSSKYRELESCAVSPGDILLSLVGTAGKLLIVPDDAPAGIINPRLIRLSFDRKRVCPHFFKYLFESSQLQRLLARNAQGGTMDVLNAGMLRPINVPLPSLPEQRAIATALSDVDALITSLDTLIAKKRDIKQAAMQQLLTGKTRLPGFSGEWEVKKLGEIGRVYGGLTGKSKVDFADGKFPYIPFMNIMSNTVINTKYFDYVNLSASENQNKAQKGDLFFNGSSETPEEVGMCSVLLHDVPNLFLNSFCFGFRLDKALGSDGLYLAYFFRSSYGRRLMYLLAQGATRYNLSKSSFLQLEIPYPSFNEQRAIAAVLSDMDAEIAALEHKRDKTRAVKQGMMHELLTGRTRLV